MASDSFSVSHSYLEKILEGTTEGDMSSFFDAIDDDVHWTVAAASGEPTQFAGVYNKQQWLEKLSAPVGARLSNKLKVKILSIDVVSPTKAIVETISDATQRNGKPYNNTFCWIFIFSPKTGKIVKIREYLNSALLLQLLENNEPQPPSQ
ncbi:hypothetical protein FISHEDRAFT_59197 [Fistulina hepatica ATCC 64428]|uniref:SnoaL-like domain-containing protein n=1 Tax=Fistulina hepatica ATCC 64428 TaxID=1128425 RepID=A0A0D7AB61_9AGAR|nr:hypothetical protein FISHEDRAFT_59197 [Fistulina hepatica ATCC 64428]